MSAGATIRSLPSRHMCLRVSPAARARVAVSGWPAPQLVADVHRQTEVPSGGPLAGADRARGGQGHPRQTSDTERLPPTAYSGPRATSVESLIEGCHRVSNGRHLSHWAGGRAFVAGGRAFVAGGRAFVAGGRVFVAGGRVFVAVSDRGGTAEEVVQTRPGGGYSTTATARTLSVADHSFRSGSTTLAVWPGRLHAAYHRGCCMARK